jgi:L-serine dehydratase
MLGATPEQVGKALVLALSPTIGTPCTPRVMVAGLCATHLGGGILIGHFAANLAVKTSIPLNVPPDVMIAMAAAVHPQSAKHIVPTVIKYMEPFFKTNDAVEHYIHQDIKDKETIRIDETISQAKNEARALAAKANSIVKPFGDAVVGGSSQAVGSPTNTARIAHGLIEGEVTAVKVELYPELFARRGINVPGILMAAVRGAGTDNYKCYRSIMGEVNKSKLKVEIIEVDEPQLQRITITATGKSAMVEALNRGGGRLVIKNALPSVDIAKQVARKLDIEVVD